MKKKKNYNKIPKIIMEKVNESESPYFKVGTLLKINNKNINQFEKLGLELIENELVYNQKKLPLPTAGRYSKYNCKGRTIKRIDLPKIAKVFWGECYPYGNTNASKIEYSYTKDVWQVDEWMPQFLKICICVKESIGNDFIVQFEVDDILDKKSSDFEHELLFAINLMQENVGKFEVYSKEIGPNEVENLEYIDWEFLPPGEVDKEYIRQCFKGKTLKEQEEIWERYDFVKSLNPECMVKGTNYFSKYFGAKFKNNVMVLENVDSGNAIYVFHQDWEELSKLSRSELRKINSKKVTRITHHGNWRKKLEFIIKQI